MPVVNFTPAFMATGLVCPPDKPRIEYSVADEPGLFVECRSSAKAVPTWWLRLKCPNKGTNIYKRLGTVKELSLTQARKQARQLKAEHAAAPKQPNIVFFLADDLGNADLGYRGSETRTPSLDKLAAEGARLESSYAQQVCSPARAATSSTRPETSPAAAASQK